MHSVIQTAIGHFLGTAIAVGVLEALFLAVAGIAAYKEPEARNWHTVMLFALPALAIGCGLSAMASGLSAYQALEDRWMFKYQPSPPTFLVLALVMTLIATWATWKFRRLLKPKPPSPPPRGRKSSPVIQLQLRSADVDTHTAEPDQRAALSGGPSAPDPPDDHPAGIPFLVIFPYNSASATSTGCRPDPENRRAQLSTASV